MNQTFKDFELIIVDNCSTDESEEVIKTFSDRRIRFYKNERNIGLVENWNKCVSLSNGEYICILHSDDTYSPTFLERGVKFLDSAPKVGMVYTLCNFINHKNEVIGKQISIWDKDKDCIINGEEVFKRLILENFITAGSVMVRKECYEKLGGYDLQASFCSDWEMWMRISLNYDVGFIPEPLANCRFHNARMSVYCPHIKYLVEYYTVLLKLYLNLQENNNPAVYPRIKIPLRFRPVIATEMVRSGGFLARKTIEYSITPGDSWVRAIKIWIYFLFGFLMEGTIFLKKLKKLFKIFKIFKIFKGIYNRVKGV